MDILRRLNRFQPFDLTHSNLAIQHLPLEIVIVLGGRVENARVGDSIPNVHHLAGGRGRNIKHFHLILI